MWLSSHDIQQTSAYSTDTTNEQIPQQPTEIDLSISNKPLLTNQIAQITPIFNTKQNELYIYMIKIRTQPQNWLQLIQQKT